MSKMAKPKYQTRRQTETKVERDSRPYTTLHARACDGGYTIKMYSPKHFEILFAGTDVPSVYKSARQLLLALSGGSDRHWSLNRYFRLGKYAPKRAWAEPAFDLFEEFREAEGIDLTKRSHEVEKLLFSGFGQWIFGAGYDPDDVLQEVYKGLLARNQGQCVWDGDKSSFGHYVHMVCHGVLANYHRKEKKKREVEQTGIKSYNEHGDSELTDVSSASHLKADMDGARRDVEMEEAAESLKTFLEKSSRAHTQEGRAALTILPYIQEGYTRTEIADLAGISKATVSRGLTYLRTVARDWAVRP